MNKVYIVGYSKLARRLVADACAALGLPYSLKDEEARVLCKDRTALVATAALGFQNSLLEKLDHAFEHGYDVEVQRMKTQYDIAGKIDFFNVFIEAKTAWLQQQHRKWKAAQLCVLASNTVRVNFERVGVSPAQVLAILAKPFELSVAVIEQAEQELEPLWEDKHFYNFQTILDNPAKAKLQRISQQ